MNTKDDTYDIRGKLEIARKAIKELDEAVDADDLFVGYAMNIDMIDDLNAAVRVCDELQTAVDILYPLPLGSNEEQIESAENTDKPVILYVEYYPYERYFDSGQKKARISGPNLLEALKKMVDHMELYINSEVIEEDSDTVEEVLEAINNMNGDGCDYITYLENKTTGDVYINEDYVEEEEDWD